MKKIVRNIKLRACGNIHGPSLYLIFFTVHRAQSGVPDVNFAAPICPGAEACAPEPNVRQEPNASQAIRLMLPSPCHRHGDDWSVGIIGCHLFSSGKKSQDIFFGLWHNRHFRNIGSHILHFAEAVNEIRFGRCFVKIMVRSNNLCAGNVDCINHLPYNVIACKDLYVNNISIAGCSNCFVKFGVFFPVGIGCTPPSLSVRNVQRRGVLPITSRSSFTSSVTFAISSTSSYQSIRHSIRSICMSR